MKIWVLLCAIVCHMCSYGQSLFEFKCNDGQKLTFKVTSETTVEVTQHLKKPYEYTYIEIPDEINVKNHVYKVTGINGAFQGYKQLKGVKIPSTIITIGNYSFKGCTSLSTIHLPSSLKNIGKWAFQMCTMLKNVEIPNSVSSIGEFAFEGCTTLKSVKLSSSLSAIGKGAFQYCGKLESVEGLRSDIKIGDNAFYMCAFNAEKTKNGENEFEQYAQKFIVPRLKEWQKKREFETTAQYQSRVTKEKQAAKTQELMEMAIKEYTKIHGLSLKLGQYDADYQLYTIETNYGKRYVKVPIDEAPAFKNRFAQAVCEGNYMPTTEGLKLTGLVVSLSGKKYYSVVMDSEKPSADISINLPEINLPIASASNQKKEKSSAISMERSLDTDIPMVENSNTNTFAIIIGNEKYQKVAEVPYANNDAKIVASYFKKTLGLPTQNISLYENVTYGTMLTAISDIESIAEAYEGNLNVLFYYAGHGIPNEANHDAYLLPVDADGKHVEVCYPVSRLYHELGKLKAKNVIVFMDACFSGAKRGDGMLNSARSVAIKAKSPTPQGKMVVFSAAQGDETAYPYKEKGHGLFTYFLLKKIQETEGNCTLGELSAYIKKNVLRQSVVINRKSQTPTIQFSTSLTNDWENLKLR